jgi:hypothetical protein
MQTNDVETKNTQTPLTTEKLVDIAKDKAETIFDKEFSGASISTKISLPEEVNKPYLNALLNLKEYSTYFRENKQNTANALRFLNAYKQSVKELRAAVEQLNKKEVEEAIAIDWTGWEDPTEFIAMGNTVEIVSACMLKQTTITIVLKQAIETVENGVINIDKLFQLMKKASDSNIKKLLSEAIQMTVVDVTKQYPDENSDEVLTNLAGALGCDTRKDAMEEISNALLSAIKASMIKRESRKLETYTSSSTTDDGMSGWAIAGIALALIGAVGIGIWAYSRFKEGDVTIVSSFDTGGHMNAVGGFFG